TDVTCLFHEDHQAGIATQVQDRLMFAAFDLTLGSAGELRDLLRAWTEAAAAMTQGAPSGSPAGHLLAPPSDTGEALGLGPARLSITFGLGSGVFSQGG